VVGRDCLQKYGVVECVFEMCVLHNRIFAFCSPGLQPSAAKCSSLRKLAASDISSPGTSTFNT
jgi:hypothetical protein